jgi:hypothetical protein
VNDNCARFSKFNRSYLPEIKNNLENPGTGLSTVYSTTMAGLRTRIDFPNLMFWKDSVLKANKGTHILIQKARIIIPANTQDDAKFPPNNLLNLITKDSKGNLLNTLDNLSGIDYAGGLYDNIKKQYIFNVARHLQAIIDGKIEDLGLFVQAPETGVSAKRVQLNGNTNLQKPMQIELLYQVLQY